MFGGAAVVAQNYDLSEYGTAMLENGGIYTVDDAVDRFMEAIEDERIRIEDNRRQIVTLAALQLREPLKIDYDAEMQRLRWSIITHESLLENLEKDLSCILDRGVPF